MPRFRLPLDKLIAANWSAQSGEFLKAEGPSAESFDSALICRCSDLNAAMMANDAIVCHICKKDLIVAAVAALPEYQYDEIFCLM